jgi:hypothetical protein
VRTLRSVLPPALIIGLLWFAFYGQRYWMAALGLFDIPGEELFAAMFVVAAIVGLVWPGPSVSVAAGAAGLVGALTALVLTGEIESFAQRGFSVWWLSFFAMPAAAHVLGTAARVAFEGRQRRFA